MTELAIGQPEQIEQIDGTEKLAVEEVPLEEKVAVEEPKVDNEAQEKIDFLKDEDAKDTKDGDGEDEDAKDTKDDDGEDEDAKDNDVVADNGDEDDESSSDEEMVGFFDCPPEIMEGKRKRISTTRVDVAKPEEETEKKSEEYKGGPGMKLRNIAYVNKELSGEPHNDLVPLHKLCFGHRYPIGKNNSKARTQLKEFSGFDFECSDPIFKKREYFLYRFNKDGLKYICGLLGIDITITTEVTTTDAAGAEGTTTKVTDMSDVDIRKTLMEFLVKPYNTGFMPNTSMPAVRAPKPKKPKRKSDETAEPKKRRSKKKSIENEDEEGDGKLSPKKKEPTQVRIGVPKKKRTSDAKRKAEDSEDDDAPLVKKKKNEPSDEEVRALVALILKDANLEEVTMKIVCRQVYETYPGVDMLGRKDFIKNTVKEIIQSS